MGWIKNRIKAEHRKHKSLDWERIAEAKIKLNLKESLLKEIRETIEANEGITIDQMHWVEADINKVLGVN